MKKNLRLRLWTLFIFAGLFCSSMAFGQATLKHSYTFESGTYDETTVFDQKGSLNGTLGGTKISIANGKATVSGATANSDGWISLDGVALALNTYTAVTLEAFVETGATLNSSFTMLAYFGTATPGSGCFWIQPTRSGNETRIETNNLSTTVTALKGAYELDDGKIHHVVAVLNAEALTYYIDGMVVAQTATGANYVSTIGTAVANLFRGVDGWNDPNYNASLLEFNIYDGTLDQNTIAKAAGKFLGLDMTNPALQNLAINVGTLAPAFDPATDIYEVTVPYGTTKMTISANPVVTGAIVKMLDGLGNELTGGVVTFNKDEGIDIEIEVTALDAVAKKSYWIQVFPEDGKSSATLASINLSKGSLIGTFLMDSTSYTALVPTGTTSVNVTGVPNWNKATVTGGGAVALTNGRGSTTLTVKSENSTATKVYTIEIYTSIVTTGTDFYLVHEANGFVAAESGAAFNQVILADAAYQDNSQIWQFENSGVAGQYYIKNKAGNYMSLSRTSANAWDLEVYTDLPSVNLDSARFILNEFEPGRFHIISVRKQQASATNNMLGPNNANLASPLFNDKLANNPLTVFNIKLPKDVVSQYDVKLASLTINGASLKPVFNPAYKEYFATISAGVTSVEVTATPQDPTATVTGAGNVDVSAGKGTITVTVTAAADPASKRDYIINYLSDTQLTLKHSYTFDDGTANDQVGDADGTVKGGTFTDGKFIAEKEGDYIVLPADKIAINTYPSITMEAHVTTGVNPGWTMYSYFGNSSGGDHTYFISIAGNNSQARAVLNLGDGEVQAGSIEPGSGEVHHFVSVITNDTLYWYVDGDLAQKTANKASYRIKDISNANAWLGFGAYNDPTWLGTTNEYDIYSGQMDAATVKQRAIHFLGNISTDATLSSLTVDAGELIPVFDPEITTYSVIIPNGTTTINVSAVANNAKSTVEGAGPVDVSSGSGSATIVVTAENHSKKTYNIAFSTPTEFTLMHSYTFEDGTASDVVGNADGMLMGAGTIANGAYTAAANGDYIELPAADIAINTYAAITLEGYIYSDVDNTGSTMLAYFGGNENAVGGNGYFFTPDRNAESRTAISCGNLTAPWNAEQGITGPAVSVGEKHHVVSVLTNSSIKWYIDGLLVGEAAVSGANSIAGISSVNAWLCKGGYTADPSWMGTIDEFNVYSGVLDAATIAEHAEQYLGGGSLTLMHSYTFEDGTAKDVVGDADGMIMGTGTIANGAYKATANGDFIELPAAVIAINTYSAITLEGYIYTDVDNTAAVMMAYFGGNENGVGGNGYFFTPDRWTESRSAISCGNITAPWEAEQGITGAPVSVGEKHHVISVLTESAIKWYIDGALVGETAVTGNNKIANISNANAWLCKGGYTADPTWMGTIDEFNIYEGEMDAATIAEHAEQYLADFTLMHSYTFEDGTAKDVVGNADGILKGTGTIANGAYKAAANGDFIELPAAGIAINTYSAITLEGYIYTDVDNTAAVMMAYFGGNENGVGGNGYFFTPDRWTESRSAISCGNITAPWEAEQGITGAPVSVGEKHHVVSVLSDSSIKWYIDGALAGETAVSGNNSIANLSNANAWLCKGGYTADPTWMGTIHEFNIYEGEMDAATIAQRANDFTTGISVGNLDEAQIKVYPTYSVGDFTVETTGSRGMITVYNLVGKLIVQKQIESSRETVTVPNRGMYIMKVQSDNSLKTFKVFKTE